MAEPDLLIEAGFSDAKLAREVAKITAKYKQAGEAAEKAFKDASGAVGDNQKLRAHMRELDKLQRTYDPVYTATKKYEAAIKQLDRALQMGAIDQAKYTAEINRAQMEMGKTAGLVETTVRRASQGGAGGFQNLGYQVQDFAVQVGAGTSATQAFAQQFPQLASGFGPVGIALGTAGAVLVPLAAALWSAAGNSQSLDERISDLTKTTDAMTAAVEAAEIPISVLRDRYGDLADEVARANGAMAMMATIRARSDVLGAARSLSGPVGNIRPARSAGLSDQEWAAVQASIMDDLRKKTGATVDQVDRLRMALNRTDSSNSLEAVARDAESLLNVIADLYQGADERQRRFLDGWAAQVTATMSAAKQQIEAGVREESRLFDAYDQNTRKLASLANDRAAAEKGLAEAVQSGNQDKIDSYQRVLGAIDDEVLGVKKAIAEIDGTLDAFINRMKERAGEIGGAISQAIENYTGWTPAQFGKDAEASQKGIRDLIKSRESGGDYNVTLDNGAYTGGARDLVNMTINEVLAMQREMLAHPNNKKNSSAAGAYQIVRRTLQSLVDELGLTGEEQFSREMQDRLADQLIRRRRGQGIEGLRNEWEGLRNVSPALINQAMGAQTIPGVDPEVEKRNAQALKEQANEQKRKLDLARQLSEQLSANLLTEEKSAELARQRNEQIAAINASDMSDADKAAAIALVNAELERQRTIFMLMEEAKRRNVDLDAQMVNSTLTYRDAILQLGDARAQQVVADQQAAAAADRLKQAQDFAAQQTQALKDGLVDAIVEGENFADVLANVAQALAKAALQAALFGDGPFSSGGSGLLGGLFSGLMGGFGGGSNVSAWRPPSYAGGGFTGMGSRSGGIDGRGGFPAILHPNETVIDHTRGQRAGGGGSVDVRVFMDENGNWKAQVERISGKVSAATVASSNRARSDQQYLKGGR